MEDKESAVPCSKQGRSCSGVILLHNGLAMLDSASVPTGDSKSGSNIFHKQEGRRDEIQPRNERVKRPAERWIAM